MSDDFMDDVGLEAVVGVPRASDILGGAEVFEGQRIQELPLAHESMHWLDPKSAPLRKVLREFPKLRDALVHSKDLVHPLHLLVVFFAHSYLVQIRQFLINLTPKTSLLSSVFDVWNIHTNYVILGHLGDFVPPLSIRILLQSKLSFAILLRQARFSYPIKVFEFLGKPINFD